MAWTKEKAAEHRKKYWKEHKEELLARRRCDKERKRNAEATRKQRLLKKVRAYQIYVDLGNEVKCRACGFDHPKVLHFHHIDSSTKKFEIMKVLASSYAVKWDEIEEEIKKCELLCANCHLIEHTLWDEDVFRQALSLPS